MRLLVPSGPGRDGKPGKPFIYSLQEERHALRKAGVSFIEWTRMTRWQRADVLSRHIEDTKTLAKMAKEGLGGIVSAVLAKLLGI